MLLVFTEHLADFRAPGLVEVGVVHAEYLTTLFVFFIEVFDGKNVSFVLVGALRWHHAQLVQPDKFGYLLMRGLARDSYKTQVCQEALNRLPLLRLEHTTLLKLVQIAIHCAADRAIVLLIGFHLSALIELRETEVTLNSLLSNRH